MTHMSEVESLFAERKRVSEIAREMRTPIGTVWCWKKKGEIPPWRRPAVLDAIRRLDIDVEPEVVAYLAKAG